MWKHPAWLIALAMTLPLLASPALAAPPGFHVHPGEHPGVTEARAFVLGSTLAANAHTTRLHYQCGHLRGEDLAACDRVCAWPADDTCGFVTQHGAAGAALLEAHPERSGDAAAAARALGYSKERAAAAALHLQTRLRWEDPRAPTHPTRPLTPALRRDLLRADVRVSGARDAAALSQRAGERARVYARVWGKSHPKALLAAVELDLATLDAGLPTLAARGLERSVRALASALPEDHPDLAMARVGHARALFWTGDVERALALSERATRSLERVYGPGHWALIPALVARSDMHLDLGEPMRAVTLAERALTNAITHGDSWGPLTFDPLLAMARAQVALYDLTNPSLLLLTIDQMVANTDLVLSRRQRIDLALTRAAVDFRQVARLGDGVDQTLPDNYRELITSSNASLTEARELILETYGQGHWYHARVMTQFGAFFHLAGSPEQALESFDISKTFASMAQTKDFILTYQLDEQRARILAAKGELGAARDLARRTATALDAKHPRRLLDRSRAHRTLALVLWRLGEIEQARASHASARELLISGLRMDSGEKVGDTQLLNYFTTFIVMVQEGLSLADPGDVEDTMDSLLELQGSVVRLSRERTAWSRITARIPIELRGDLTALRDGEAIGFESKAEEKRLRKLLSPFEASLAVAPDRPGRDAVCARLSRERAHLVNYVSLVRHRGFEPNPEAASRYHGARTGIRTELTFEALVVDPKCGTRLIPIASLDEVRDKVEAYRAAAEAAEVCYEEKGRATRCRRAFGALEAAGAAVRATVWDPVEAHILPPKQRKSSRKKQRAAARPVYVVPDDKLTQVPLDGLPYDDGTYVIERHVMTSLPYALALASTPRDLEHVAGPSRGGRGAFVLGDVDYGEGAYGDTALRAVRTCNKRGCKAFEARAEEVALASSRGTSAPMSSACVADNAWGALRTEALAVAELLSGTFGRDVVLSTGDGATEFVARTLLPGRRVIHLATHGFFSTSGPCLINASRPVRNLIDAFIGDEPRFDFSRLGAIVLAGVNDKARLSNPRDDGLLNGADIASLDLTSAELVVLSACQTALGLEVAGEGSFGLTRGFILAGARDIVGSLWQVPSQPTSDLFRDMYTAMMSRRTRAAPPEALRRAKLGAIDRALSAGVTSSSFLWAAFVPMRTRR